MNDQIKQLNQIMKQYLKCYVNYQQNNWIELLSAAQFAYNNSTQAFTEISSFQAEYDRDMNINNKIIKLKKNNKQAIQQDKKMGAGVDQQTWRVTRIRSPEWCERGDICSGEPAEYSVRMTSYTCSGTLINAAMRSWLEYMKTNLSLRRRLNVWRKNRASRRQAELSRSSAMSSTRTIGPKASLVVRVSAFRRGFARHRLAHLWPTSPLNKTADFGPRDS